MNKHFLNKRLAHQIGFAGLIPFTLLMLACWFVDIDWLPTFVNGQLVYGVIILSFLGGIHWGAIMVSSELSASQTKRALYWSIVPVVIACIATMSRNFHLAVLTAGFIGSYQIDKRLYHWYKLADWFLRLRFILTGIAVAALLLTLVGANIRG
jgi:hypothetical protein